MNFLSFLLVNRPNQALSAYWGDDPANNVSRNLQTLIVVAIGDGADKLTAYGIDPAHIGPDDQPIYEIAIPDMSLLSPVLQIVSTGAVAQTAVTSYVPVPSPQPPPQGPLLRVVVQYAAMMMNDDDLPGAILAAA
jgi:hypothetical protein